MTFERQFVTCCFQHCQTKEVTLSTVSNKRGYPFNIVKQKRLPFQHCQSKEVILSTLSNKSGYPFNIAFTNALWTLNTNLHGVRRNKYHFHIANLVLNIVQNCSFIKKRRTIENQLTHSSK